MVIYFIFFALTTVSILVSCLKGDKKETDPNDEPYSKIDKSETMPPSSEAGGSEMMGLKSCQRQSRSSYQKSIRRSEVEMKSKEDTSNMKSVNDECSAPNSSTMALVQILRKEPESSENISSYENPSTSAVNSVQKDTSEVKQLRAATSNYQTPARQPTHHSNLLRNWAAEQQSSESSSIAPLVKDGRNGEEKSVLSSVKNDVKVDSVMSCPDDTSAMASFQSNPTVLQNIVGPASKSEILPVIPVSKMETVDETTTKNCPDTSAMTSVQNNPTGLQNNVGPVSKSEILPVIQVSKMESVDDRTTKKLPDNLSDTKKKVSFDVDPVNNEKYQSPESDGVNPNRSFLSRQLADVENESYRQKAANISSKSVSIKSRREATDSSRTSCKSASLRNKDDEPSCSEKENNPAMDV